MDSILSSVKKMVGIPEDMKNFDADIIFFTNAALMSVQQIGIGPDVGFAVSDSSEEWVDLIGDDLRKEAVKTYIGLKVRLMFDPPTNSYMIDLIKGQISELEWRLCNPTIGGL